MREQDNKIDADIIDGIAGELEHIDDEGNRSEDVVTAVEREAAPSEPTPESEDAGEEKPVDDDRAVEEDPTLLEKPAVEDESKKDDEPVLPDAYRRAAIHQGWKPEDVDEYFAANSELAMRTFGNIHESTNKISQEFADLGRASIKSPETKPDEPNGSGEKRKPDEPNGSGEKRFSYERMDVEAMEKDDPDNPLLAVVKGLDVGLANMVDVANEMYESRQADRTDVEAKLLPR